MENADRTELSVPSKQNSRTLASTILLALLVILVAAYVVKHPGTEQRYYSDQLIATDGAWKTLDLFGRYTEGSATFTSKVGAKASLELGQAIPVSTVKIRLYVYPGQATNTLAVQAGEEKRDIVYGNQRAGISVETVLFDPPVTVERLTFSAKTIGNGTILIDGVVVAAEQAGFDVLRMATHVGLLAIVVACVWLAVRFTKGPPVSSGRVYLSVDMLRGIGASLVVLLHATGYSGQPDLSAFPFISRLAGNGHFGVEIFYVVSAFTLTFSISSALRRGKTGIVSDFWLRRVIRIVPVFAMTLIVCLALSTVFTLPKSLVTFQNLGAVLFRYATLSYVFDPQILKAPISHSVWWSISTEFQFYILMPLLSLPFIAGLLSFGWKDNVKGAAVGLAIAVAGVLLAASWRSIFDGQQWLAYTVLYHLDAFFLGIAIAIPFAIFAPGERFSPKPARMAPIYAVAAFAALAMAVAFATTISSGLPLSDSFEPPRLVVLFACAAVILVLRFAENRGAFDNNLLSGLRALGLLSFVIYLTHVPVMQFVARFPVPTTIGTFEGVYFWTLSLSVSIVILVSLVLHIAVEMPVLALNRNPRFVHWFTKISFAYVILVSGVIAWSLVRAVASVSS
ncbi:acyltransferase family protein [Zhengella mangrovi]|nr:acyltransferase [Zhengella mangrovi]